MSTPTKRDSEEKIVVCVVRSVSEIEHYDMRESPDADLRHRQGFHVGLEVVRTIDQQVAETRTRMECATKAVHGELESRGNIGHFSVQFDLAELSLTSSTEYGDLARRVADCIATHEGEVLDVGLLRPAGVRCVVRVRRSPAPSTLVNWSYSKLPEQTLTASVLEKKHKKLRRYRRDNGDHFRQYWLAIASIGPGTIEDGGFTDLLDQNYSTDFDRVFLIVRGPDGSFVAAWDVTPVVGQEA